MIRIGGVIAKKAWWSHDDGKLTIVNICGTVDRRTQQQVATEAFRRQLRGSPRFIPFKTFDCSVDPGSAENLLAQPWPGYTGPNRVLGDYYVRELERIGSEHRQVVRYEVVGTGRVEQMPRSRFDRQARAA